MTTGTKIRKLTLSFPKVRFLYYIHNKCIDVPVVIYHYAINT